MRSRSDLADREGHDFQSYPQVWQTNEGFSSRKQPVLLNESLRFQLRLSLGRRSQHNVRFRQSARDVINQRASARGSHLRV